MRVEESAVKLINLGHIGFDEEGQFMRYKRFIPGGGDVLLRQPRLMGFVSNIGYVFIRVRHEGGRKNAGAHRVIWWFHHGPIPEHLEVNHKNGVKHDNRIENLELMTHQENILHAHRVLGSYDSVEPVWGSGENHTSAKLTWEQVRELRRAWAAGEANQPQLARRYGITQASVSLIVNNINWRE